MGKDLHFVENSAKITMEKNTRMSGHVFAKGCLLSNLAL